MKYRLLLVVPALLLLGLSAVYAGNSARIGTAGASELLIPIGSRGAAMGGTVTADAYGVEAVYWNPAGLASLEGTEAMFGHLPYLADIGVSFGGVATAIEGFGTLGATAKVVSVGDIQETTREQPDGTGRFYNPTLTVLGLTYAKQFTANVAFGATGMFINEKIFEMNASGMAFDVGFIYDTRWHGVKFGLTLKNYGATMKFSGKGGEVRENNHGFTPEGKAFDLPSYIALGVAYNFFNQNKNAVTLNGNFRSNNFSEDLWQGGAEYAYDGKYFLRGGYNYSKQTNYLYGATLGAGLILPIGSTKVTFEYAWNQTEVFEDNQFFTVKANF